MKGSVPCGDRSLGLTIPPIVKSTEPIRYRTLQTSCLRIVDCWMPPGKRVQAHGHPSQHACFISDGAFQERFTGSKQVLEPGNVRLSPDGAEHDIYSGRLGARLLIIHPEKGGRADLWSDLFGKTDIVNRPEFGNVRARLKRCLSSQAPSPLALEELVDELFASVRQSRARNQPIEPPVWLRQVRRAIDERFPEVPSVEHLARTAGVHRVHLSRTFQEYFGCSLTAYVQRRRLNLGWRFLQDPDRDLAQVSLESGFADQSHFTRVFSRNFDVSPGKFRRSGAPGLAPPWLSW